MLPSGLPAINHKVQLLLTVLQMPRVAAKASAFSHRSVLTQQLASATHPLLTFVLAQLFAEEGDGGKGEIRQPSNIVSQGHPGMHAPRSLSLSLPKQRTCI